MLFGIQHSAFWSILILTSCVSEWHLLVVTIIPLILSELHFAVIVIDHAFFLPLFALSSSIDLRIHNAQVEVLYCTSGSCTESPLHLPSPISYALFSTTHTSFELFPGSQTCEQLAKGYPPKKSIERNSWGKERRGYTKPNYSPLITDPTTSLAVTGLSRGDWIIGPGIPSLFFCPGANLWSYVMIRGMSL